MKLSIEQLERLANRIFRVIKASQHIVLDEKNDPLVHENIKNTILSDLEDDYHTEERLTRSAERLVQEQQAILKDSKFSPEELVNQVKARLAKSKEIILGDGPERSDSLAEKITASLWKIDSVDFASSHQKVQNCIARAIHRFRKQDDRVLNAVEKFVSERSPEIPEYSHEWCILFDRYFKEITLKMETIHNNSSAQA